LKRACILTEITGESGLMTQT